MFISFKNLPINKTASTCIGNSFAESKSSSSCDEDLSSSGSGSDSNASKKYKKIKKTGQIGTNGYHYNFENT